MSFSQDNTISDYLVGTFFLLALSIPLAGSIIHPDNKMSQVEKRKLASAPDLPGSKKQLRRYPEHLPDYMSKPGDRSVTDNFVDDMREHTDGMILDLGAALLREKVTVAVFTKGPTRTGIIQVQKLDSTRLRKTWRNAC